MIFLRSAGEFLRRYWLVLVLVGAIALWIFLKLMGKTPGAGKIAEEAASAVDKAITETQAEIKKADDLAQKRTWELRAIKEIPEEKRRLQALADFDKRRREGKV